MNELKLRLERITKKHGGRFIVLGEGLESESQILKLFCKNKHPSWLAAASDVLAGGWCQRCNPIADSLDTKRLERAKRLVKKLGGKVIDSEKVTPYSPLEWECKSGHSNFLYEKQFEFGPHCMLCEREDRNRKDLAELRSILNDRGGRLLDKAFTGWVKYYSFACKNNHKWTTTASRVKSGQWCKECWLLENPHRSRLIGSSGEVRSMTSHRVLR